MFDTYKTWPFWRTRLSDVDEVLNRVRKGEVKTLCKSAGGREIRYVIYGEKPDYHKTANFNSACGGLEPKCYADRSGKRPTLMLIGATHGQEVEGVMALLNWIQVIETGKDFRGIEVPSLALPDVRLVIIPVYNIDGRARCVPDSMIDEKNEGLRHYGQGHWLDGSFCDWPYCKRIHPIKDASSFLGAYFNDDGVNLMHDNFFAPMANETTHLFRLLEEEQPEAVIGLHGGSNSTNELLQPDYVPDYISKAVTLLAKDSARRAEKLGLPVSIREEHRTQPSYPAPSGNLTTMIFHACGAISSTYESNEGLKEENQFTAEEILLHHYCLFESLLERPWKELEPFR